MQPVQSSVLAFNALILIGKHSNWIFLHFEALKINFTEVSHNFSKCILFLLYYKWSTYFSPLTFHSNQSDNMIWIAHAPHPPKYANRLKTKSPYVPASIFMSQKFHANNRKRVKSLTFTPASFIHRQKLSEFMIRFHIWGYYIPCMNYVFIIYTKSVNVHYHYKQVNTQHLSNSDQGFWYYVSPFH